MLGDTRLFFPCCLSFLGRSAISVLIHSCFLQDTRLVYKHFATLYFVFVFDSSENELAMLDLIQGTFQAYSFSCASSHVLYMAGSIFNL